MRSSQAAASCCTRDAREFPDCDLEHSSTRRAGETRGDCNAEIVTRRREFAYRFRATSVLPPTLSSVGECRPDLAGNFELPRKDASWMANPHPAASSKSCIIYCVKESSMFSQLRTATFVIVFLLSSFSFAQVEEHFNFGRSWIHSSYRPCRKQPEYW